MGDFAMWREKEGVGEGGWGCGEEGVGGSCGLWVVEGLRGKGKGCWSKRVELGRWSWMAMGFV